MQLKNIPKGLFVLFYTEMWEVFGRVGITVLLVLYLTNVLHFSDSSSFAIYGGFIALVYISPIFGGLLCDRFLGNQRAIIMGGIIMTIGNIFLVIPAAPMVYLGLATIAVGSGLFLPSITPLVGYLYDNNEHGRDAGFTIYYLGRNLGFFFAPLACGIVSKYFGYHYAFLLSSLGMISGIIVFIYGKKHLHNCKKVEKKYGKTIYPLIILAIPLYAFILLHNLDGFLLLVTTTVILFFLFRTARERSEREKKHIIAILLLMVFVILFSSFLGEGGTVLNLFIERIINRHLFGFVVPTPIFFALDPLFMFIIGPILAAFWFILARKKKEPGVAAKFSIALFILSLGFLVFFFAALHAKTFGHASLFYVVGAYFLFPLAELCIMPIGLSMITKLAPKDLSAMTVGFWMLASAISGHLTGAISILGKIKFKMTYVADLQRAAGIYMHTFLMAAIVIAAAGLLLFILKQRHPGFISS